MKKLNETEAELKKTLLTKKKKKKEKKRCITKMFIISVQD